MRVEIRGQGIQLSERLSGQTRTRLHFALGRFSPQIESVIVRYTDLNGPRGGVDKRCRIIIRAHRLGTIIAEATGEALDGALAQASDRAGRALIRARRRARIIERTSRRVPLVKSLRPPGV